MRRGHGSDRRPIEATSIYGHGPRLQSFRSSRPLRSRSSRTDGSPDRSARFQLSKCRPLRRTRCERPRKRLVPMTDSRISAEAPPRTSQPIPAIDRSGSSHRRYPEQGPARVTRTERRCVLWRFPIRSIRRYYARGVLRARQYLSASVAAHCARYCTGARNAGSLIFSELARSMCASARQARAAVSSS
jgi:hypothetical protein